MAMKREGSHRMWSRHNPVEEEQEQEWPAPGGVGTTEEGESGELFPGRKMAKPRKRVGRAEKRERAAVAAAALKASEVGSTDNNQGLPGSVEGGRSMKETETGQSQQDEADEIWQDPRIVAYINRRNNAEDEQRAAFHQLEAELKDSRESGAWRQREIEKHKRAIQQQNALASQVSWDLEKAKQEAEAAKAAAAADNKRSEISEGLMNRIRNDSSAISNELETQTLRRHELEESYDKAKVYGKQLQVRITALESELASKTTVAAENTVLKEEIALVHSSFEDAFSDMAKGLTVDEKFAYVREHQNRNTAPAGRPRIVSTSSLHEELDDQSDHHSDAGSEHIKAVIKEPFSFSGITSVETVPVAAPIVAPAATTVSAVKPLTFSGTTSTETVPVAAPVPAVKPLGFSGITVAETVPVLPTTKPNTPLGFSNITSVDTTPTAVAVTTPVAAPKPTTPFGFSATTSVETIPIASVVVPIKKPAPEIRVHWRNRYITEHVDRPVVPWWMWLLFLIAIILCASGFAGLLRENQIWLDANDMAYQRLMGAEQETLLASVSMGVQDLLPSMGVMGHSLFG